MIDVLMVKSEAYAWSLSLLTAHEIRGLSTLPTSLRVILPSHSASPSSLPFFRHKASFFFRVWTSFSFTCVASSLSLVPGWFSSVSGLVSSKTPPWPLCQMQLHLFPTPGHLYHITYLFYLYHLLWAAFSCFTCWPPASAKCKLHEGKEASLPESPRSEKSV